MSEDVNKTGKPTNDDAANTSQNTQSIAPNITPHINENTQQSTLDDIDIQQLKVHSEEQLESETPSPATEFSNNQINPQCITTDTLHMTPLSPKFRTINLLVTAFWGGLFMIAIGVLWSGLFFDLPEHADVLSMAAFGLVSFFTLWSLVHHWFADPLKKYALREHDLNFQSGLVFRRLVSQPLLRIQHIELKRGPIERKADLATLQVFSAGGVSHTFYIPGLEYDRAVQLRQFILDHKDLASDV